MAEFWDFHPLFKLMNEMYDSVYVSMYKPRYQGFREQFTVVEWNERIVSPLLWAYKIAARTFRLLRLIRQHKPDLVVSHHDDANVTVLPSLLLLRLFRSQTRPKFVLWIRNNPTGAHTSGLSGAITTACYRYLYRFADVVVVQNESNKRVLSTAFPSLRPRIRIIPNIYELDTIRDKAKEDLSGAERKFFASGFVFMNLGRMTDQKGQWYLLRAFSAVKRHHPKARLLIIGDGPLQKDLEDLAERLGIGNALLIIPRTPNPFKYYNASDCFVFPSLYEGFPNSISEALALNTPVISADCLTGPRDILCPELKGARTSYPYYGAFGVLLKTFPAQHVFKTVEEQSLSPEEQALATTMERFMTNAKLRARYSKGSERMRVFDARRTEIQKIIRTSLGK